MDKKQLKKHFDSLKSIDRSAPFWSWNGKLEKDEIKRQAHDMYKKGMGGFFMHSRVGLDTEYMSKEWMDAIKAAVEQAKQDNTLAWLYDEDRWPSGGAGGIVSNSDKDYGSKGITLRIEDDGFYEVLKKYIAKIEEDKLIYLRDNDNNKKEDEVYIYMGYDYTLPMEWFNDTPGSDNINKDAVRKFIDSTYEVYKKEIGESFGKEVPGIFTDEPNIDGAIREYERDDLARVPWTKEFEQFFLKKRGYDFFKYAPFLFLDGQYSKKIRHDYFRTLGEIFAINFTKQIFNWCEDNNLLFTGHFLAENRMGSYILLSGGVMPNFMYEHIPGIDMLGEKCDEFMTIKKCTSVGNQMGRHRMLSETYGVSGWEFSFEGQKWIGDYQFVLGINLRCQHLTWYSMRGSRKRDYPPLFNYQTTWWEHNNLVEDYFARISSITSKGKPIRDILMIHPLSTAWTKMEIKREDNRNQSIMSEVDKFGFDLNNFTKFLLSQHYDLDYGDEDIMSKLATVEKKEMIVGQAKYKVVVIPKNCETLYESTVKLLISFMKNGGHVICFNSPPKYIEADNNQLIDEMRLNENIILVDDNKQLINVLDHIVGRQVSIIDKNDYECTNLFYMLRDHEDSKSLFVINNDRYNGYDTKIIVKGKKIEEWDLLTGKTNQVNYINEGENIIVNAEFGPCDSKMYIISNDALDSLKKDDSEYKVVKYLGPNCEFERCDPNVLVLDMCKYALNNEQYSEENEIWIHQEQFRSELEMPSIKHNRGVQRYKWIYEPHKNNKTKLKLKYKFMCIEEPKNTYLVVERIDGFSSIILNGKIIDIKKVGWHIDRSFDKIKIDDIEIGENELILECDYTNDMELENIYIIGDFAVNIKREIISESTNMYFSDWAMQGYLFYPGSMIYNFNYMDENKYKDLILEIPSFSASLMEVYVNDKKVDYIPWKAKSKVNISKHINEGMNKISIKLIGTPKNMFGPFHFANCDNRYFSSYTFAPDKHEYTKDYKTYPYGLFNQVYIYGK